MEDIKMANPKFHFEMPEEMLDYHGLAVNAGIRGDVQEQKFLAALKVMDNLVHMDMPDLKVFCKSVSKVFEDYLSVHIRPDLADKYGMFILDFLEATRNRCPVALRTLYTGRMKWITDMMSYNPYAYLEENTS